MNLSEFITEVRLVLDDPIAPTTNVVQKYADPDLVSHAIRQLQSLIRLQVQRDEGYHNLPLILKGSAARGTVQQVWHYPLPTWVANVVSIRSRPAGEAVSGEDTFSPWMWTQTVTLGDPIRKRSKFRDGGWKWDGNRTIQLWGIEPALNLYMEVAKLPARLFKATLDVVSPAPGTGRQSIYLPVSLTLGTEDLVEGSYANAEVQCTAVATLATHADNIGVTRRCIYSRANQLLTGVRHSQLFFEEAFPVLPASGDTFQSVIPMGEEHVRVLLLKVAWACFEQLANIPAQKAIASELADEMRLFNDYITPRDTFEVERWRKPGLVGMRHDHDHARQDFYP